MWIHNVGLFIMMVDIYVPTVKARVPMDYFDENVGVAKLALGRLKATKGPKKGTVFYNPGNRYCSLLRNFY